MAKPLESLLRVVRRYRLYIFGARALVVIGIAWVYITPDAALTGSWIDVDPDPRYIKADYIFRANGTYLIGLGISVTHGYLQNTSPPIRDTASGGTGQEQ